MKITFFLLFILMCSWVSGCDSTEVTAEACVGSYSYEDESGIITPAQLTLNADGTYVAHRHMPDGAPPTGKWSLKTAGMYTTIIFENTGFPIFRSGKSVRITVDADRGMWFEKEK